MTRVAVVYGSRHGATKGIAQRVAEVIGAEGAEVVLADAADRPSADGFDAYVVGGAVYTGRWTKEAIAFLEQNQAVLAARPVWLFSSGPVPVSSGIPEDLFAATFGAESGPGSGGRQQIERLAEAIHPRDHRIFLGAYNPDDPPWTFAERAIRHMPFAKRILPAGDFREWPLIESWAKDIATGLTVLPGA